MLITNMMTVEAVFILLVQIWLPSFLIIPSIVTIIGCCYSYCLHDWSYGHCCYHLHQNF